MLRKRMTLMSGNKSFCTSDASQSFVVYRSDLSTARLLKIISDDKIINHKSLGEIQHIAGNEFKELSDTTQQNSHSIYLQEQGVILATNNTYPQIYETNWKKKPKLFQLKKKKTKNCFQCTWVSQRHLACSAGTCFFLRPTSLCSLSHNK